MNIELSPEALSHATLGAESVGIPLNEFVSRLVMAHVYTNQYMFSGEIGESKVAPEAPQAQADEFKHWVVIDGVKLCGKTGKEVLMNFVSHVGAKNIYMALLDNDADRNVTSLVKRHDNNDADKHIQIEDEKGSTWFVYKNFGIPRIYEIIKQTCDMMKISFDSCAE